MEITRSVNKVKDSPKNCPSIFKRDQGLLATVIFTLPNKSLRWRIDELIRTYQAFQVHTVGAGIHWASRDGVECGLTYVLPVSGVK